MRATSTVAASLVAAVGLITLAADHVRGNGMAVKDAIQVLYAGIRESEMATGGDGNGSPATYLDDDTSTKAKYVANTLRRMIGDTVPSGDDVKTSAGPVGAVDKTAARVEHKKYRAAKDHAIDTYEEDAGDTDDISARIDHLMNKCMEATLAKNRKHAKSKTQTTVHTRTDVYALQRRLSDLLEQFVLASSAASGAPSTMATARSHHRYKVTPPAPRQSDGAGNGLLPGLFDRPLVSSGDAPSAATA